MRQCSGMSPECPEADLVCCREDAAWRRLIRSLKSSAATEPSRRCRENSERGRAGQRRAHPARLNACADADRARTDRAPTQRPRCIARLRKQAETLEVDATRSRGCPSVWPAGRRRRGEPGEDDGSGHAALRAAQRNNGWVEVPLHVVGGQLFELEILK